MALPFFGLFDIIDRDRAVTPTSWAPAATASTCSTGTGQQFSGSGDDVVADLGEAAIDEVAAVQAAGAGPSSPYPSRPISSAPAPAVPSVAVVEGQGDEVDAVDSRTTSSRA